METILETQRLAIRRLTEADLDALVALDSDPQVTFFITGGVPEFDERMLRAWLSQYERWPEYAITRADWDADRRLAR